MANLLYLNQYITTTLSVSGGIDATATTGIVIQSVSGIDTTKPGIACLTYADPLNTSSAEYIEYTSINSTTKTFQGVTRGAEGYSAKSHDNGVSVAFPVSESHVNRLADALSIGGVATNGVTTTLDEDDMASDSATALATQQSIKAYVDSNSGSAWTQYSAVTPTRASADDPTYVLTFAGVDLTSDISVGMRVKLTQSTDKYFIVTAIAFSTNTTLTLYGGTDYDVADTGTTAISAFYYSTHKAPYGFPLDVTKWRVHVDAGAFAQTSPSASTWYNSSLAINVPIGSWDVCYNSGVQGFLNAGGSFRVAITLSTTTNSETDNDMTSWIRTEAAAKVFNAPAFRRTQYTVSSKTTYTMLVQTVTSSLDQIAIMGDNGTTTLTAICAYL